MRVLFSSGLAAISKPRCGSSSLRRMLDPFMQPGDLRCDVGQPGAALHPHIPAPYLHKTLAEMGHDTGALTYFITIRHPAELLWSYWKFFRPDASGRYNFDPKWQDGATMAFEDWILRGKLGVKKDWLEFAPDWISREDLSPLSLEARAMNKDGSWAVDRVFQIEHPAELADWLSERFGHPVPVITTNQSYAAELPPIGEEAKAKIQLMLPEESRLYAY